jgi:hypothetical protein
MLLVAQGSNNIVDKQPSVVVFPGMQGIPGDSGVGAIPSGTLINVVFGAPSAESANTIEVLATCTDFDNSVFLSGLVSVRLRISDSAASNEPSDNAIFVNPAIIVGQNLSGLGTATVVYMTNSSGQFRISIQDTTTGDRYVWLEAGGHSQLFCRAKDGILHLIFT